MGTFLKNLFYDPLVGKIIAAALGIIIINMLVRFLQRTLAARIKEKNARYGLRRGLAFFGYLAAVLLLAAIFSDQFSSASPRGYGRVEVNTYFPLPLGRGLELKAG